MKKLSETIIQELEQLGYSNGHKYLYKAKQIDGITHVFRLSRSFDLNSKWEEIGVL